MDEKVANNKKCRLCSTDKTTEVYLIFLPTPDISSKLKMFRQAVIYSVNDEPYEVATHKILCCYCKINEMSLGYT